MGDSQLQFLQFPVVLVINMYNQSQQQPQLDTGAKQKGQLSECTSKGTSTNPLKTSPADSTPQAFSRIASSKATNEATQPQNSLSELQKYEQYFEHKLNRIYFSKQLLLEMITHFEAIDQPLSLRVHDMQLFIFLLDSIEYLNNLALISEFDLDLEDYDSDRELKLSKDVIKLSKIKPPYKAKLDEKKKFYYLKFKLIDEKFLKSVESRATILQEHFKAQKEMVSFFEGIKSLIFPKADHLKHVYDTHLESVKDQITPQGKQQITQNQLTLLYLWDYLIQFTMQENESFKFNREELGTLKAKLFGVERSKMLDCLFKEAEGSPRKMVKV